MQAPRLVILDNAFDPALMRAAAGEWPAADWPGWTVRYESAIERKQACDDWKVLPPAVHRLLQELVAFPASDHFPGALFPDLNLWGGGLHSAAAGGILDLHVDANEHAAAGLARRVNGILCLNETWREEWGGAFELWDPERTRPTVRVAPVYNRLVLFATGDDTPHAVTPVACPEGHQRQTLACWWYGPWQYQAKVRRRAQFVPRAGEEPDAEKDALRRARAS